ncbi:MAG: hypothetical protein QOE14_274, partial [Humisphaera sp.]|nr:hypothetical protein [Humisphaera sp.]
ATRGQTIDEVLKSNIDLWGEAALKQQGGPTYEFFENKLPPFRYVETPFRVYPIVLSAPAAPKKVRLLGDGSQVNALARQLNWIGEEGMPVTFSVGMKRERFGSNPKNLVGPKLAGGYLPIVQMHYRDGDGNVYAQETFADVDGDSPKLGVAFVRFALPEAKTAGKIEAQFDGIGRATAKDGVLRSADGKTILACYDEMWTWNVARGTLTAFLKQGENATLAIYTVPGETPIAIRDATNDSTDKQRLLRIFADRLQHCADKWNDLLARGATFETPEPLVNNAWRASTINNYMLLTNDDIRYSHGNQYAKLYIGEGTDALRTFMLFGHEDDARKMVTPLYVYTRKGLEFHQAAFKLQMLAHYWRVTRDVQFLKDKRALWEKELNVILNGREKESGMLPREKYAGDIDTMVLSLNSNSNCWRALRDWSIVLDEGLGEKERGQKLAQTAAEYRKTILDLIDKSWNNQTTPPFLPMALGGEEKPYDPITSVRMGGYWNIMMHYVLGSGVFTPESETADRVMKYLQQHGGHIMGMLSSHAETQNYWIAPRKVNDLYGMRYALLLLRRDEPDRALVSFYGKLAHGFTRDTFIGGEGSDVVPLDEFGRLMYLPPNSAANASFLQQLRYLLVQDYDLNDDGRAETLRLAFATPRAWLKNGARIRVTKAPTEFGDVSFVIESALKDGRIDADVTIPERQTPEKVLLRLRLPDGKQIASATANGKKVGVEKGETIDLSGLKGKVRVRAQVGK